MRDPDCGVDNGRIDVSAEFLKEFGCIHGCANAEVLFSIIKLKHHSVTS
jgi:hypothetical protein